MIDDVDGDDDDRQPLQGVSRMSRHFAEFLYYMVLVHTWIHPIHRSYEMVLSLSQFCGCGNCVTESKNTG